MQRDRLRNIFSKWYNCSTHGPLVAQYLFMYKCTTRIKGCKWKKNLKRINHTMWLIQPKKATQEQININNKQMQRACELLMDFSWSEKEICQTICSELFTVIMATGRHETSNLDWWFLSFSANPSHELKKKSLFTGFAKAHVLFRPQSLHDYLQSL